MKKEKGILLINPFIHDFKAYNYWMSPIGLLKIGKALKKKGFKVYLIDLQHEGRINNLPDGRSELKSTEIKKPDIYKKIKRKYKQYGMEEKEFIHLLYKHKKIVNYVFITSYMTYWYKGVKKTYEIIKNTLKEVQIFIGGIYPTLMYKHAKETFKEAHVIKGDFFSSKTANDFNLQVSFEEMPDYSFYKKRDYVVFNTSSGCPLRCNYCVVYKIKPEYTTFSYKSLKNFFNSQKDKGIKNFVFYDDALLLNDNFYKLLEYAKDFNVNFYTPNGLHAKYISKENAKLLYKANVKRLYLGLESTNKKTMLESGNKIDTSDFLKAVQNLIKAGYSSKQIHSYILMGYPGEDEQDIKESIKFASRAGTTPHLSEFSPITGSKIIKNLELPFEKEPLYQNNTFWVNYYLGSESVKNIKNFALQLRRKNGII